MATIRAITDKDKSRFDDYFSVADELSGELTLEDLDLDIIYNAKMWKAVVQDAPWPPELWWAEEWNNQVRQLKDGVPWEVLLSERYTNERLSRRFG